MTREKFNEIADEIRAFFKKLEEQHNVWFQASDHGLSINPWDGTESFQMESLSQ